MFQSIIYDIKNSFRDGNMLTKLILVNLIAFVVINLLYAFTRNVDDGLFFNSIITNLGIPSDPMTLLKKPWTILTHMFVHQGFWHFLWNMVMLYWFGRIVGDLIGDKHVLPVYLFAGVFAGMIYILGGLIIPGSGGLFAIGASGAIMAFVILAAFIAPDYYMHLILIGPVRIKYIALAIVFMDIIGAAGNINSGGHIAHIGGAFFGWLYGLSLREGTDLSDKFYAVTDKVKSDKSSKRSPLKVEYRSDDKVKRAKAENRTKTNTHIGDHEAELNKILEKIKSEGYEKLSKEEKEFLFLASKKK